MALPQNTTDAERILAEFVSDVRAAGAAQLRSDWPDLYITFKKAEKLLDFTNGGG